VFRPIFDAEYRNPVYSGVDMRPPVVITTPMPTLDEIGRELGLSAATQKSLIRLVDSNRSRKSGSYAFKTLAAGSPQKSARVKLKRRTPEKADARARKTA
jgi:hypothetical protein